MPVAVFTIFVFTVKCIWKNILKFKKNSIIELNLINNLNKIFLHC